MNLCSYKPLMGIGSEELFNTQTVDYGVGLVNWLCPQFRAAAWWGWQIYGAAAHVQNTFFLLLPVSLNDVYQTEQETVAEGFDHTAQSIWLTSKGTTVKVVMARDK